MEPCVCLSHRFPRKQRQSKEQNLNRATHLLTRTLEKSTREARTMVFSTAVPLQGLTNSRKVTEQL